MAKSFMIFCYHDFETKLKIPAAFVKDHGLHLLPRLFLQLKTQPARRSWAVKIKKINGDFYIADGWSQFVKDNDILEMKLLIFYIVAASSLRVAIFGHDSCLELPPSSRGVDRPRFDFVLTQARKYRTYLFHEFAEKADLMDKRSVVLQFPPKRRHWPVLVQKNRLRRRCTLELTQGWVGFRVANGLVYGRRYSFEFDSAENVILVKELKN
ncbi:B3 domain-containing protein Os03g0212300-like [Salvia miltiorrhiza]|uniref:B3 domain-containing protein Os03g0212300-like n=1 Tax=Salvia miltiorrhiza TaxID=226208 RepID=UPI0025AB6F7E|nr:B3 domain-containing protein Os03g0212300-like [Salvia miltiorrhiza]